MEFKDILNYIDENKNEYFKNLIVSNRKKLKEKREKQLQEENKCTQ